MLRKISTLLAILALPMAAFAGQYRTIEQPRQECWTERVAVQGAGYAGPILGGVVGGVLGNQVGDGSGRVLATVAGVAAGAVVGDHLSSRGTSYQNVQRCRTVMERTQVPVYHRPAPVYQPVYYVEPARHPGRHGHHGWKDEGHRGLGHGHGHSKHHGH